MLIVLFQFFFFVPIKVISFETLNNLMTYENKIISLVIMGLNIPISANCGYYDKGEYKNQRSDVIKNYVSSRMLPEIIILFLLILEGQIWDGFLLFYFY